MPKCQWKDCQEEAIKTLFDKHNQLWTQLCEKHLHELEDAISHGDAGATIGAWILSSGGKEAMRKKMKPTIQAAVNLMRFLSEASTKK